jgi:hypothetical protein
VIVKGFKKCCISNAVDDILWEEAENVGSEEVKLGMATVRVVKLGLMTLEVMKLGTVKTVRPTGGTG